jgi:hypothetical protein
MSLSARRLLPLAGVLSLLACTGCIPNVAWLPDSSGFIHSGAEGRQLIHYDLAARKARVFVQDTGAPTYWPAVSPDGKRVAVARYVQNKDFANTLEVIVYDLQGKEVQRSTAFRWSAPTGKANGNLVEAYLCWAPQSEHLIVLAGDNTGIYDVRNDGLIVIDQAFPFVIGSSPVRPEGDGFLVARPAGDAALRYTFITWEGREYDIAMDPVDVGERRDWLQFPFLYNARWQGNTAVVTHAAEELRLDTVKRWGAFQGGQPRESAAGEQLQQVVFANGSVLRVQSYLVRSGTNDVNENTYTRTEWLERPGAKPCVLVDRSEATLVFPAPNRRLVALRCSPQGKGHVILVVNEQGEIVAEVPGDK